MKGPFLTLIQAAHAALVGPSARRFAFAARNCEAVQGRVLARILATNAGSAYGKMHGFGGITSLRDWQERVPVVDHETLRPWIARAAAGEPQVLTEEPIRMFERTGGSSGIDKLIPYTDSLLREFAAATGPWLYDLHAKVPGLRSTTGYWSISPATRTGGTTSGGIPVGFQDDTEYFGKFQRWALRHLLAVPPEVARIRDMGAWQEATLLHLLQDGNLGLVSVWHPSFLSLLLAPLEANPDAWLSRLSPTRSREIAGRLGKMGLCEALWPRLALISCWADGPASASVAELATRFPKALVQPKGLLATEGVISFPLLLDSGPACVAAVAGHFLEFEDLQNPGKAPLLAHALRQGGTYAPLLSTGGGLYRYRLGDAVRCMGFYNQAPLLHFEGRIDQVSDLRGEKLDPRHVEDAMVRSFAAVDTHPAFALLVPHEGSSAHYRLLLDGVNEERLEALGAALETELCRGHAYGYARALGQLGPVQPILVQDGQGRLLRARMRLGQRLGDIKPTSLDTGLAAREEFA